MFDTMTAVSSFLGQPLDTLAALSGSKISTSIRTFVSPLVLIGISLVAIYYLLIVKQMTRFLQFAGLAILAGIFFYVPGVVEGASTTLSGWFT